MLSMPGDLFLLSMPGDLFMLSMPGDLFMLSMPGDLFMLSMPGDLFILVYGVDSRDSFDEVKRLVEEVGQLKGAKNKTYLPKKEVPPLIIVGNKCDRNADRQVAFSDLKEAAQVSWRRPIFTFLTFIRPCKQYHEQNKTFFSLCDQRIVSTAPVSAISHIQSRHGQPHACTLYIVKLAQKQDI